MPVHKPRVIYPLVRDLAESIDWSWQKLTLQFEPSELEYRGEGNATVVVAHQSSREVLRLRKHTPNLSEVPHVAKKPEMKKRCQCPETRDHCCKCVQQHIITLSKLKRRKLKKPPKSLNLSFLYANNVMKRLLGARFLPRMDVIHMSAANLRKICEQIRSSRPSYRLDSEVDTNYHEVIVASDCALLPVELSHNTVGDTLCVEIKAKCGFVTRAYMSNPKIRTKLCRFCLLQYHLKKSNLYSGRSKYCPCDLFSGHSERMTAALKALIETPQINFRVFYNGVLKYFHGSTPEDLSHCLKDFFASSNRYSELQSSEMVDLFVDLLSKILCFEYVGDNSQYSYPSTKYTQQCVGSRLPDCSGQTDSTRLSVNCVLGRILKVQLKDSLSLDAVLPHYKKLANWMSDKNIEWEFLYLFSLLEDPVDDDLVAFTKAHHAPGDITQAAQVYSRYLQSAVAKDCSIMIALQASSGAPDHSSVTDTLGGKFVFNSSIVDLDPKPFHKIKQHYKEEQEASNCYKQAKQIANGNISQLSTSSS